MSRKARILDALQTGEESASNLALICDCPRESIRRTIQVLRRDGHNICFADSSEQLYRLKVS
jgi:DNA-binding IclR family transcriptional regulator